MHAPLRSRLGLLLVLAPIALQVVVVRVFGVNMLIWDEFFYTDFILKVRAGESWLPWLLVQHNEHRVVPTKLIMALLAPWTAWNTVAEMYVSAVLAGVVVWGLWRLYRQCGGTDLFTFAPAAWLVCSLAQYQNILYGLMTCHYFTLAGLVWALVFLGRPGAPSLAAAVLCGLVATSSIANGLLVWPVGLALLLARGAPRARVLAWAAAAAAAFFGYFYRFRLAPQTTLVSLDLRGLSRAAVYALTVLGAPLGAGSTDWSRAAGLALAVLIVALALRWWRQGRPAAEAPLVALILLGVLSCGLIAAGRATSSTSAVESRYIAYSSLAVTGAWLLAAGLRKIVAALLIPALLAANLWGLREARFSKVDRLHERFLLQTAESQPDEALRGIYLLPDLRRIVPALRAHRLGPFSEPGS